jgi:hypothetical protein
MTREHLFHSLATWRTPRRNDPSVHDENSVNISILFGTRYGAISYFELSGTDRVYGMFAARRECA